MKARSAIRIGSWFAWDHLRSMHFSGCGGDEVSRCKPLDMAQEDAAN